MAELRTEEEQVEALKRWWRNNGRSLLLGIVIASAVALGWNYYQDNQRQEAEQASVYFQRMLTYANMAEASPENIAIIRQNAAKLISNFDGTIYAQYAALMLAKLAVDDQDLTLAESQLRWVLAQAEATSELALVSNIRLAQLLHADGRFDEALALLADQDDAWQGRRLETKGDILVSLGKLQAARDAYTKARQIANQQGTNSGLLSLKLDNLATN